MCFRLELLLEYLDQHCLTSHSFSLQRDRKNALRQLIADFKAAFSDETAAFREYEIAL